MIFIDESGVHKLTGHSSFAVVYVEVEDLDNLNKRLVEINNSLKIDFFHWSDQRLKIRRKYLRLVNKISFRFKVAIFENPIDTDVAFDRIFQYLIREKNIRSVIIDGKKPKWYEKKLKKELRNHGISVKRLKTIRKEISEPGLQLADALAGLSIYCFENTRNNDYNPLFEKLKKSGKLLVQMIF